MPKTEVFRSKKASLLTVDVIGPQVVQRLLFHPFLDEPGLSVFNLEPVKMSEEALLVLEWRSSGPVRVRRSAPWLRHASKAPCQVTVALETNW